MDLRTAESILKTYSSLFVRAYIHGSVATGSNDEWSDVDLILIRKTDQPFFDRIREVMQLIRELGAVDILIYTPDEQESLAQEPGRYFIKDVFDRGYRIEGTQGRGSALAATGTK